MSQFLQTPYFCTFFFKVHNAIQKYIYDIYVYLVFVASAIHSALYEAESAADFVFFRLCFGRDDIFVPFLFLNPGTHKPTSINHMEHVIITNTYLCSECFNDNTRFTFQTIMQRLGSFTNAFVSG